MEQGRGIHAAGEAVIQSINFCHAERAFQQAMSLVTLRALLRKAQGKRIIAFVNLHQGHLPALNGAFANFRGHIQLSGFPCVARTLSAFDHAASNADFFRTFAFAGFVLTGFSRDFLSQFGRYFCLRRCPLGQWPEFCRNVATYKSKEDYILFQNFPSPEKLCELLAKATRN